MKLSKKKIGGVFSGILLLGALLILYVFFLPNGLHSDSKLIIRDNERYEDILSEMEQQSFVKNFITFKIAALVLDFKGNIKKGKYQFSEKDNNFTIIKKLRRGQHFPVTFTFNNIRTLDQFLQKVEGKFLFDIEELATLLNNYHFLSFQGFTRENVIAVFIPNTYEFYYDIEAEEFFDLMKRQHAKFWNEKRRALADSLQLTIPEIVTLASIVEEENFKEKEKGMIAGLYINRLRKGMKLQADPTVKFALGDFAKKRILNEDLQIDSPYNTYMYEGLPPGPIRIPATSTIDSVLQYRQHDYIFMCAKEDFSGMHNFAKTDTEHMKNAAKYHRALNARN
jgi:UPF0755 protein